MPRLSKTVVPKKSTITLTFGDQAENSVGMQKIGTMASTGFNLEDLKKVKAIFSSVKIECEIVCLNELTETEDAWILIARNAIKNADELMIEQMELDWDTKALMRGRVVNKRARHNLCYADFSQVADYANGKGTIISYSEIPHTDELRKMIASLLDEKTENLMCEGNLYYDVAKTGIGFHGDSERRKVIAVRLGESMPIAFQWYQNLEPIGEIFATILNHGDFYIMSEKTVGTDWKKRKIPTLRHSAGCTKYTGKLFNT